LAVVLRLCGLYDDQMREML